MAFQPHSQGSTTANWLEPTPPRLPRTYSAMNALSELPLQHPAPRFIRPGSPSMDEFRSESPMSEPPHSQQEKYTMSDGSKLGREDSIAKFRAAYGGNLYVPQQVGEMGNPAINSGRNAVYSRSATFSRQAPSGYNRLAGDHKTEEWPMPLCPPKVLLPGIPYTRRGIENLDDDLFQQWIQACDREDNDRLSPLINSASLFQKTLATSCNLDGTYWHHNYEGEKTRDVYLPESCIGMTASHVLGKGAVGLVEQVQYGSILMARKKFPTACDRQVMITMMENEKENMRKLENHKHFVTLLGTLRENDGGEEMFYVLTSPAAKCNLETYLKLCEGWFSQPGKRGIKGARKLIDATLGDAHYSYLENQGGFAAMHYLESALTRRLDEILGCLTTAVEWMHHQGVRHFDLKPSNIVLSPGELFITDFGISLDLKELEESKRESDRGKTWAFSAPEIQDIKRDYSPASADIYSLGCIALHIATVRYSENTSRWSHKGKLKATTSPLEGNQENGTNHFNITRCQEILQPKRTSTESREKEIEALLLEIECSECVLSMVGRVSKLKTPQPYLSIIRKMMATDPSKRPSATNINEELHEKGGIEQIYHGTCCRIRRLDHDLFYNSKFKFCPKSRSNMEAYLPKAIYRRSQLDFTDGWAIDPSVEHGGLPQADFQVLTTLDTLLQALAEQGDPASALSLSKLILEKRQSVLGYKHPDTLASMRSHALLLFASNGSNGRQHAVMSLCKVWEARVESLSQKHPQTLLSLGELALALWHNGKRKGAEEKLRELLGLQQKHLGKDYEGTIRTTHNLALVLCHDRRFGEAETLLNKTMGSTHKMLKSQAAILERWNILVGIYEGQAKDELARESRQECMRLQKKIRKTMWGNYAYTDIHLQVLSIAENFGMSLLEQNKYRDAEQVFRQVKQMNEDLRGKRPANATCRLAIALIHQNKRDEAQTLYGHIEDGQNSDASAELYILRELAQTLMDEKDYVKAEHALREAWRLINKEPELGAQRSIIKDALAHVLEQQGKYKEAMQQHPLPLIPTTKWPASSKASTTRNTSELERPALAPLSLTKAKSEAEMSRKAKVKAKKEMAAEIAPLKKFGSSLRRLPSWVPFRPSKSSSKTPSTSIT